VNFNYVSLGREMELRRSFAFMVSDNYFRLMGAPGGGAILYRGGDPAKRE
jgi:hypothetical protein